MTLQLASLDAPSAKPEIVNGRYKIPDPITGKSRMWTRATTFAKSMADEYHLTRWKLRMTATGLVVRKDLYAAVASSLPKDPDFPTKDEKARLNDLCDDAMDAAGSAKGSNLGTALHDFTDAVDSGRTMVIPPPWDADIAAYRAVMEASDYTILPQHIEQVVTVPSLSVAGKFDRILGYAELLRIGDLKTAKGLDLGWGEIAIQLALYAHAETIFDPATQTHHEMPAVDQDVALVMHLPVGQATCKLYEVDIAAGWEAAQLALGVRNWRKRSDLAQQINLLAGDPAHISQPLAVVTSTISSFSPDPFAGLPGDDGRPQTDRTSTDPAFDPTCQRCDLARHTCHGCGADLGHGIEVCAKCKRAWLLERREAVIAIEGGREALAANWPAGVPFLMATEDHTLDQLEQIQRALTVAEGLVVAPLPDDDPTDPRINVVAKDDPRVADVVARLKLLPPDLLAAVEAGGKKAKLPNFSRGPITEAHLGAVTELLAAAETEYAPRATQISNALALAAEHGVSEAALCAVLGVRSARHIHGFHLQLLDDLADAINHPDRVVVERDGALVVDQPASLLAAYGNDRSRLWRAGQQAAKANGMESPKDSDAVLAHPLLAAVLLAV